MKLSPSPLAVLVLAAPLASASANGRFPASRNVVVSNSGSTWVVPSTFGVLVSHDGGETVRWVCEDAMGYSGTYDPWFVIANDGALWMTSFDGVRVSRDGGCTWSPVGAPFDDLFPGSLTRDSAGRLWAVTAQSGAENSAFRNDEPSANSFDPLNLSAEGGLFTSVAVAPSMTSRAYVGGFSIPGSGVPEALLFRTDDDGETWQPLPVDDFVLGSQPQLSVVAVAPEDPDLVLARVGRNASSGGDVLYRSDNGGLSFEGILTISGTIESVLIRADGTIVVGAGTQGVRISSDGGDSFATALDTPLLTCATEHDGVVLGCGSNVAPDLFAVGESSDAITWSPVFRLSDIAGPLECPAGTVQADTCVGLWPALAEQLGAGQGEQEGDAGVTRPPPTDGCGCRAAETHGPWPRLWTGLVLLSICLSGRRRRPCSDRRAAA